MNEDISKKDVYTFFDKKSDKLAIEYMFWQTHRESWNFVRTVYSADHGTSTTEMAIPNSVLDQILIDRAKEGLSE